MRKPISQKNSILLVLLCVLLALNSCKEDIPEIIEEDYTKIIISKDVVVIDDQTWKENFLKMDSSNYTLTFSDKSDVIKKIVEGNIIVSGVGNGLMRKVKSIRVSAPQLVFITEPTVLTDLISQGALQYAQQLIPEQANALYADGIGLILNDNNLKSTENTNEFNFYIDKNFNNGKVKLKGNFKCSFNLDANIDIRLSGLKEVKFGFVANEDLNIDFSANSAFDNHSEEEIAWICDFPSVTISILPPIVLTPKLKLKVGYWGNSDRAFSTGFMQKFKYDSGIQWYKNSGWKKYGFYANNQTFYGPTTSATIPDANVEAYIKPEVEVSINNMIGPYANLKLYGKLVGTNPGQNQNQNPAEYTIWKGMSLGAGVRVDVLSWSWSYDVADILSYENPCYNFLALTPPTISIGKIENISPNQASVSWNVESLGNKPLVEQGVCWRRISGNEGTTCSLEGIATGSFISTSPGLVPDSRYITYAYINSAPYQSSDGLTAYSSQTYCSPEISFTTPSGSFVDERDNHRYNYVNIGNQTWMADNLAYLPEVSPSANMSKVLPHYYVAGFEGENVLNAKATPNYKKYGVLYNYPAASTACPAGWHLPTDDEWKTLEMFLGMSQTDADKGGWRDSGEVGKKLKNSYDWDLNGDNSSGFMALPGGGYWWEGHDITSAYFWTSSIFPFPANNNTFYIWHRRLNTFEHGVYRNKSNPQNGYSVRCIKNPTSNNISE